MIIFHCTCRQELLQAREKHKEEQVMALKRSMESGMVSFYFLQDCFYSNLTSSNFVKDNYFVTHFVVQQFTGAGNERASSTQGGDGLSVQAWKL